MIFFIICSIKNYTKDLLRFSSVVVSSENGENTLIKIDEKLCKGCDICYTICPVNVFKKSDKINKKGYFIPNPVNDDKCIKCGLCVVMCPEFAIYLDD